MKLRVNGVTLNVAVRGEGPPLLLLHGFTGSSASWAEVAPALGQGRRLIMPDILGHGESDAPADPARYAMPACVADVLALLDALDAPRADVLGYSMGGRVALSLAAAAPQRVARLVLESATAGIEDAAERAARVAADEALADSIGREGLAAFVARWEALPLFASQARLPEATRARVRAGRLRNSPLGLANSLRGLGTGRMPPLWERLPALRMPVLLLAGALDRKYVALARRLAESLADARMVEVAGCGHTIHLERPDVFTDSVRGFLDAPAVPVV